MRIGQPEFLGCESICVVIQLYSREKWFYWHAQEGVF